MTEFDLGNNELTGAIPTQIGMMTKIETAIASTGFLSYNEHSNSTIPTQLGQLTALTDPGYFLYSSHLTGTAPTELGQLTVLARECDEDLRSL